MRPTDEEPMAEITESLQALVEAEVRWTRLVHKIHAGKPAPAAIPRTLKLVGTPDRGDMPLCR